ncbi:MAG: tagatose-6-phosphate ketose isomerase [Acidobacteria bacterium]|nr:tagatose-6-phosphate ketose isomerase [Acidobacteriota bacterium]
MSAGRFTRAEIFQQPETWPDTLRRVREAGLGRLIAPVLTGAGTSAYAAMAVAGAWPGASAVPSTELFLEGHPRKLVVSFARSGNSPESVAVVEKVPARHIAVTCNAKGRLARHPGVEAIVLDPRTNDRSLVMTSSFTNLVLAGLSLAEPRAMIRVLPLLCAGAAQVLAEHEATARRLAANRPARMVVLASAPLAGAAHEASLKVLEMTAGRVTPLVETYLSLRHGPMSFLDAKTVVLCFVSSDPRRRRYELDLVRELRVKKLGRLIALGTADLPRNLFDEAISTPASNLPDSLRTPAEIIFPQLLAFHLSLGLDLDPDRPSPGGVIHRVVRGVRIYED